MILIFDLDDTLYEERTYVESGLAAVADYGEATFGWPKEQSLKFLTEALEREGRGRLFDLWLASHGRQNRAGVRACVGVYRAHQPRLELAPAARRMLDLYGGRAPLYLVTDGHKGVQAAKVEALGLWPAFRKVYITHRYGVKNAKPSIHCFDLIRRREGCGFEDLVYVGDNPAKDFVGLNPLGVTTVRVLTGMHRDALAPPGGEARFRIETLDALPSVIGPPP